MSYPQYSKFSPLTVAAKKNIRQLRLDMGFSVKQGARLMDISRRLLEDIETTRNYGCHIDLETLAKFKVAYKASLDDIVGDLPQDQHSEFFDRPRKRLLKS